MTLTMNHSPGIQEFKIANDSTEAKDNEGLIPKYNINDNVIQIDSDPKLLL